MADYTVRVQLMGDPTSEEYEDLHAKMSALGFERQVKGSDRTVALPHGLYFGQSDDATKGVCETVAASARKVQSKVKVFVAQTSHWAAI